MQCRKNTDAGKRGGFVRRQAFQAKQEERLGSGTTHPEPDRRAGRPPGHEPPRPGPSTGEATV